MSTARTSTTPAVINGRAVLITGEVSPVIDAGELILWDMNLRVEIQATGEAHMVGGGFLWPTGHSRSGEPPQVFRIADHNAHLYRFARSIGISLILAADGYPADPAAFRRGTTAHAALSALLDQVNVAASGQFDAFRLIANGTSPAPCPARPLVPTLDVQAVHAPTLPHAPPHARAQVATPQSQAGEDTISVELVGDASSHALVRLTDTVASREILVKVERVKVGAAASFVRATYSRDGRGPVDPASAAAWRDLGSDDHVRVALERSVSFLLLASEDVRWAPWARPTSRLQDMVIPD